MSETNRYIAKLITTKYKQKILEQTIRIINERFEKRIRDMELYAQLFYASILSSYSRANTFASNVGLVFPELEAITQALYAMSRKKQNKTGSFETSKAFDVARSLKLRYKIPLYTSGNILKYKLTFTVNHPLLIALEEGEVSWEGMESSRIMRILYAALSTLESKKEQGKINRRVRRPVEREILKAIKQLKHGKFNLVKNKRPYMEITVKNLIQQKDFIDILIKQ